MNPIAVLATLKRGLAIARRFWQYKKRLDKSIASADQLMEALDDVDILHTYIEGEEVYLYLLAYQTLAAMPQLDVVPDDVKEALVLHSLSEYRDSNPAADAMATLTEFAHIFGQEVQSYRPSFAQEVRDYLTGPERFLLTDPVRVFAESRIPLSARAKTLLAIYGLTPDDWADFLEFAANDQVAAYWAKFDNEYSRTSLQRFTTFLGLVLQGAMSVDSAEDEFITLAKGPFAFGLNATALQPQISYIKSRDRLGLDRSLTTEMVQAKSVQITRNRGWVKTLDGTYAPYRDVYEVPELTKEGQPKLDAANRPIVSFVRKQPDEMNSRNKLSTALSTAQALQNLIGEALKLPKKRGRSVSKPRT